ncbi:MAG: pyridoxine 5'-phosphate synthase [Bordetella sp.]|nr:MAG: pyridoxine 5'-phosphate synthase [Bordetella sp.]
MIELGVNIDHIATLREQRGTIYPDPLEAALSAEEAGADLITLHLREDRRHIQDSDVYRIRSSILTRMNLECSLSPEILKIAIDVKPDNVCLVPENRKELTTEGGLDIINNFYIIRDAINLLVEKGISVTLFIDPDLKQIELASKLKVAAIEIHTGFYAQSITKDMRDMEINRISHAVSEGLRYGLRINAGHGLHYDNVIPIAKINGISELNIGHSIVAKAVFNGWKNSVSDMKALIFKARL